MREFTQTNLDPGNCWQTAVACLLEVEPEMLPFQCDYDKIRVDPDGTRTHVGKSYQSALAGYLRKHHGLAYMQLYQPLSTLSMLRIVEPGWHMMAGRTVRSATNGEKRHMVVGRFGEVVWDPHPSRAGLLDEINWAFLVPFPKEWERYAGDEPCECPACKGDVSLRSEP